MLRFIFFISLVFIVSSCLYSQDFESHFFPKSNCLDDETRARIIEENIRSMKMLNIYKENNGGERNTTQFVWPLRQADGFNDPSYYLISNFVDHDPTSGLLDYNCGNRTYNGHKGTDIVIWPFMWAKQNKGQVDVIAAAPGTIINKQDGNFDENCTFTGSWNAVYIQHADGSVAWYGHMKKNSLTTKAVGTTVSEGEYLGKVASSGWSTAPHLHFEVYANSAQTNLIDPFDGNCNNTNQGSSWWASQPPYIDPALLKLSIYDCVPSQPDGCPSNTYDLCEQDFFNPGATIRFGTHYRMQRSNTTTIHRVKNPLKVIWVSWNQTPNQSYTYGSWWYWNYTLPTTLVPGVWTYEVVYNGVTYIKNFTVMDNNSQNVGIGNSFPGSKLEVTGGDIYLKNTNSGVIIRSANGKCWRITVNNTGTLSSVSVRCPDSF
jgi:murein DD-endopeptidase MepM/ murein hydrolase activator NlpD